MTVAALAEPALMLGLFTVALWGGSLNLGDLVRDDGVARALRPTPASCSPPRRSSSSCIAEAGRVPVDNPATHLELTMIHEAMVLEYSGPDLALVEWASALKELLFMTAARQPLPAPRAGRRPRARPPLAIAAGLYAGKVFLLAVAVTLVEATNAKLRFFRVPGADGRVARPGLPGPGHPLPVRTPPMNQDLVILCAAGMLVTAYLMVGQKALFAAIRLYGLQSILLGVRRGGDGVSPTIARTSSPAPRSRSGSRACSSPGSSCASSTASASTARSSRS